MYQSRVARFVLQVLNRPLVEAASVQPGGPQTVGEFDGFRQVSGGAGSGGFHPDRHLTPLEFDQQLKLADYLARQNALARRIVHIKGEVVVGGGVKVTLGNEASDKANELLEDFWKSNNMNQRVVRMAKGLSRHGERIYPVAVDARGNVRLGFVHSGDVDYIAFAPASDEPEAVVLQGTSDPATRTFLVIRKRTESDIGPENPRKLQPDQYDGDLFYFTANRDEGEPRGTSDLLALADWLDAIDDMPYIGLDRARQLLKTFYDVKLEGMDEASILEWLKTATPPANGSIRAHNERVTWEIRAPELAASEIGSLYSTIKELVAAGAGLPMTWLATGENANKASAGEMTLPTMRMLTERRKLCIDAIQTIVHFVLDEGVRANRITLAERDACDVQVTASELEDSKVSKLASAVQQVTTALALMVDAGWISENVARRVVQLMLGQLGVEYDPETDAADVEAEKADREAKEAKAAEEAVAKLRLMREPNDKAKDDADAAPAEE